MASTEADPGDTTQTQPAIRLRCVPATRWHIQRVIFQVRAGLPAARSELGWCIGLSLFWGCYATPRFGARAIPLGLLLGMTTALWRLGLREAKDARVLGPIARLEGHSERVWVRSPTRDDMAGLVATIDDEVRTVNGLRDCDIRRFALQSRYPVVGHEAGQLVIESCIDGRIIGEASFSHIDFDERTAWLGLWIGPDHRGQGYASEVATAITTLAWDLGFDRIGIATAEDNAAVRHLCEHSGARPFGEPTVYRRPDGTFTWGVTYVLHRPAVSHSTACDDAHA